MKILRYLLFPFGCVYYTIVSLRNLLYNKKVLKSSEFDVPIICVGNLSVGGTGKTPHSEYLIRLLKDQFNVATLSRGYGRKTVGFIQATNESTSKDLGDEPYQMFNKFKNEINVFVEAKRVLGIINIMGIEPKTNAIILDDAFQHRAVKSGFSILLTDYNNPYYKDYILPGGNLREPISGRARANLIIVSKCPNDLSQVKIKEIENQLKILPHQEVYFTKIKYGGIKSFNPNFEDLSIQSLNKNDVVLITGIANPEQLVEKLEKEKVNFKHVKFPDHHNFTKKNISNIIDIFEKLQSHNKIILTTEKDAVRLQNHDRLNELPIYFLEIEIEFLNNKQSFDHQILEYVKQNQGNS